MLLSSHISAYARCLVGKVCGLVRSIWGISLGEDKLGARDRILNTKVARQACAGRGPGKHSPIATALGCQWDRGDRGGAKGITLSWWIFE